MELDLDLIIKKLKFLLDGKIESLFFVVSLEKLENFEKE